MRHGCSQFAKLGPMAWERIAVPLDLRDWADRALPVARALARRLGVRLDAVVVTDPGVDARAGEGEVRRHARSVGCELDGVELRTDEDVADGILAVAGTPDTLLCMATHARSAAADLVIQSVSEQVLRRSTRPVLAIGPRTVIDPLPRFEDVVCCIGDDLGLARRLLPAAADWDHQLGRGVVLVQVVKPGTHLPLDWISRGELTQELSDRGVGATWQAEHDADPATGILRFADTRDGPVVVMASHGRAGLRRLALGSVTLDVLRRSAYPVLVVPGTAAAP